MADITGDTERRRPACPAGRPISAISYGAGHGYRPSHREAPGAHRSRQGLGRSICRLYRSRTGPDSDLDLFIDYDPGRKFSLLDLVRIKFFPEDRMGVTVDVTTRDSLHPGLRDGIERTARPVF